MNKHWGNLGAIILPQGGVQFRVWAPHARSIAVKLFKKNSTTTLILKREENGYYGAIVPKAKKGDRYVYLINGSLERPDPASRFQPEGVHRASEIIDPHAFQWTDGRWRGMNMQGMVLYELHVGTFTQEGTFAAAAKKLKYLKRLGVNCIELMPVHQFPGKANWGYDGVGMYAVQCTYGGPSGLKHFVNACHKEGMAVCLDVVYNHLGPEGNYLRDYGPYFTNKYRTPWGEAMNYDDKHASEVRHFVINNAYQWVKEYRVDALRLDAVHAIFDRSRKHLLEELKEVIEREVAKKEKRHIQIIAETDTNERKLIQRRQKGGFGLDGQWSDDFHHAAHVLFTRESAGYYKDYSGINDLTNAFSKTHVYAGRYSKFRKRTYGEKVHDIPFERFVINIQNHDQIGNRPWGDRLSSHLSIQQQKCMAAMLLLNAHTPLIFMGQEYGETAPFQYFVDHQDAGLIDAVRRGRLREFRSFGWKSIPDPKSKKVFLNSRLRWNKIKTRRGQSLIQVYQQCIKLRQGPIIQSMTRKNLKVSCHQDRGYIRLLWKGASHKSHMVVFSVSNKRSKSTLA